MACVPKRCRRSGLAQAENLCLRGMGKEGVDALSDSEIRGSTAGFLDNNCVQIGALLSTFHYEKLSYRRDSARCVKQQFKVT